MAERVSRRDVLRGSAAALAGLTVGGKAMAEGFAPRKPKSARLRFGVIGVGGKGWSGMMWAAEHGDIVALCDVDTKPRAQGLAEFPRAATFEDYRVMLRTMHEEMDGVIIRTPDHTHSTSAAMAMKLGLHTYCEKPLTRTIWEARQLRNIARDKGVETQMGNQSTANSPMRQAAEAIRSGAFGAVKEVHLWTDRAGGWWKQGVPRPPDAAAPKNVDFDLWLGPRPERHYAEGYHPFAWRGFWDFGTGSLGDMGCHIFNMPFMALDLIDPLTVKAETSGHNRESFPEWAIVHYEFGQRGGRGPVDLWWYDGGKKPAASLVSGHEYGGNGVIVVCEKATIYSPDSNNETFHVLGGDGRMPDVKYRQSNGHMAEFAEAIQGGPECVSNFVNYAGPLTETVLLGNLAIWADGPKLDWDARAMKVKGTDEFDSLIKPTFRKGWEL